MLQQELRESQANTIPCCHSERINNKDVTACLEGICDLSVKAYAAVVYLRLETRDGVQLSLIASKTRVAPLVAKTIPRLELLSALILARLRPHIEETLKGLIGIMSICYCGLIWKLHFTGFVEKAGMQTVCAKTGLL